MLSTFYLLLIPYYNHITSVMLQAAFHRAMRQSITTYGSNLSNIIIIIIIIIINNNNIYNNSNNNNNNNNRILLLKSSTRFKALSIGSYNMYLCTG